MNHFIRKLTVDLRLSTASNAFAVQQQMSQFCRQLIEPTVEPIFDEFSRDNFLQIDRLEIDLGIVPLNESQWESLLTTALREALYQRLHEWLATAPATNVQSRPESIFVQWLYFLQTGRLSWSAMTLPDTWQVDVLAILASRQGAVQQVQKQLKTYQQALQRLIQQHSDVFLQQLVEGATAQPQHLLLTGLAELKRVAQMPHFKQLLAYKATDRPLLTHFLAELKQGMSDRRLEVYFWTFILAEVLIRANQLEAISLLQRTWQVLFNERHQLSTYVKRRKRQLPVLSDALAAVKQLAPVRTEQQPKAVKPASESKLPPDQPDTSAQVNEENAVKNPRQASRQEISVESSEQSDKHIPSKQPQNRLGTEPLSPENTALATDTSKYENDFTEVKPINLERLPNLPDDPLELADGFFLVNAGIVLLSPFIEPLFRQVGLLEGFRFKDETAQQKAILLLHYAATGQTSAPEYSLLMPKVLCGWPLNQPLDYSLTIDPTEANEVDELLHAAIEHWGALGNTSPDALREGFLQRPGKLRQVQGVWWLQVETQTLDILLDRLPYSWGFNHIMLPWMPELVRVEWR